MAPLKAPGPDGLSPCFFQKNFEVVKDSTVYFIKEAFAQGNFSTHMNEALILLIPKIEKLEEMAQFRPIALCNVISKVIIKILANQIKPLMSKLVTENQASHRLHSCGSRNDTLYEAQI